MSEPDSPSNPALDADARADSTGSVNVTGSTVSIRGDVVGGDKIIQGDSVETKIVFTEEQSYDVRGCENPYLGLSAFTYAERAKYAGREKLTSETVARVTAPAAPIPLLFITGASGSGKSSFAQAGLIPALETFYNGFTVKHAVMRPAGDPFAALNDALWRQLRVDQTFEVLQDLEGYLAKTPPSQINLLVLDQFEEFFTQSPAAAREQFFALLANAPAFGKTRTHIIATMRADYLPELFNHPALYEIAKRGVDLRAMTAEELHDAILQPLRASAYSQEKKFEPALVDKLAEDAAQDAAYLPLLQVTLQELWRKGSLKREAYSDLTNAIKQRADQVLEFRDFDDANPDEKREPAEQSALLNMLLDLVDVSPGDDAHRDVRRQRAKADLTRGDMQRERWVKELSDARLLSVEQGSADGKRIEVDLIHETLLTNWTRLQSAIAERRSELRRRARFEQNLDEWLAQKRKDDYLLEGVRLAEARELDAAGDVALQSENAKAYLRASAARAEEEQQAELERERQRADALKQRARIFRFAVIGLSALLVIAVIASILAFRATDSANIANATAQAAVTRALIGEQNAANAAQTAESERADAEQARADAETAADAADTAARESGRQKILADNAKATAEAEADARATAEAVALGQARVAESRRLAAQSGLMRSSNPDGALLVGVEAVKLDQNYEVLNNLVTALQETQQIVTLLRGQTDVVKSVAFSPDGKILASGSCAERPGGIYCRRGEIRLWDVSSRKEIEPALFGHGTIVTGVLFAPDGKTLASASEDSTILLWDVATHHRIGALEGLYGASVTSMAFSPDGKVLAAGSTDTRIRLWDVTEQKQIGELTGHTGAVNGVAFRSDGKILESSSSDDTIRTWDVSKSVQVEQPISVNLGESVAFSPDGRTLASGTFDAIQLWDATTGEKVGGPFTGHQDTVLSVVFSPDGKYLASGSCGQRDADAACVQGQVRVWDVASGKEIGQPLLGHTDTVNSLAFRFDGTVLASGGSDRVIQLWDISSPADAGHPVQIDLGSVRSVAFRRDVGMLATGATNGTIRLWDAVKGEPIGQALAGHTDAVNSLAFSQDGTLLASGANNGEIRLWAVASGKEIGEPLVTGSGSVDSVVFSPDGKTLASSLYYISIQLWDVPSGKPRGGPIEEHSGMVSRLEFSPDGKLLAWLTSANTVRLWDVSNGKPARELETGFVNANEIAFSPDGNTLAVGGCTHVRYSGCYHGEIRLWDVATGKEFGQALSGPANSVNSIAFSPEGRFLASGGGDKTIRLWDISTRKEIGQPFAGHTSSVYRVVFAPDGNSLVSGSWDGSIRRWDTKVGLWTARACESVNRNLTRAEYAQFINRDAAAYDSDYAKNPTCAGLPVEPLPTPTATAGP